MATKKKTKQKTRRLPRQEIISPSHNLWVTICLITTRREQEDKGDSAYRRHA